jgi:hypothetical protein
MLPEFHTNNVALRTSALRRCSLLVALAFTVSSPILVAQTSTFADWKTVDQQNGTAVGSIGAVDVTLTAPGILTVPNTTVLDGSTARFSGAEFSPRTAKSDAIYLQIAGVRQRYTFSFSAPIRDPILHFSNMSSLAVLDTTNATRLSGNSAISVDRGVVAGVYDGVSRQGEGSVRLNGVFSTVSFTASYAYNNDGIWVQISGTPVQGEIAKITPTRAIRIGFPTEPSRLYQIQYRSAAAAGQWLSLGGIIVGDGAETVRYDTGLPDDERFYRVFVVQ